MVDMEFVLPWIQKNFSLLLPKCEYLIPFAVRTRYPGASDPVDDDMKRALVYAQDIIEAVKSKLPK